MWLISFDRLVLVKNLNPIDMKTDSEADITAHPEGEVNANPMVGPLCRSSARYLTSFAGRLKSWTTSIANHGKTDTLLLPIPAIAGKSQDPVMPGISASYHATDTLPDGRTVYLRAIRPGDRENLRRGFQQLSQASVRDRFFSVKLDLTPNELTYFTEVDFLHHVALVAELQDGTQLRPVGVGRFVRNNDQPDHSEIALTVIDELQGKGIGKVLLYRLIDCARELGVRHLDATVLAQNTRVSDMLSKTGLPLQATTADGIKTISLTL
jgi:GNAT superfamily N-acetyltransferase